MSVADPLADRVDGAALDIPEEPTELKAALRATLLGGGSWDGQAPPLDLAAWLWLQWVGGLESQGFSREQFDRVLVDSRRESWLWLMGDRRWVQLADGIAGRISRRLPLPDGA